MRYFYIFLWLVVVGFLVGFVSLNSSVVPIDYYVGKTSLYLPLLLMIAVLLGMLIGVLFMLRPLYRSRRRYRRMRQKVLAAEKEVKNLRTMPLKDDV